MSESDETLKAPDPEVGTGEEDEDESDVPEAGALDVIIEAGRFQTTLDILQSVDGEAILRMGRDGLDVAIVDPGQHYMVHYDAAPSAFEHVGEGMFPIGTYLERLEDAISKASDDTLVKLGFDEETRKLNVEYTTENVSVDVNIAAIDPDSIRSEPDMPELDLPNTAELTAGQFTDAVDVADMVSTHVAIEGRPHDEEVAFTASGDTDDAHVSFGADELEDQYADVREGVHSTFGLVFLKDIASVVPKDATLELQFGEEFPLFVSYTFAGGDIEVLHMVAPRIGKNA